MKTIKKEIDINTTPARVWDALLKPESYAVWASVFSPGAKIETDMKEGSKVVFLGAENSGLVGRIIKNIPTELFQVEYDGMINNGVEDLESDIAKVMKGLRETYTLINKDGLTRLLIDCHMPDDYYEMMSASWDKALQVLKTLAEKEA